MHGATAGALRACGLSRQKIRYARALAASGTPCLARVRQNDTLDIRQALDLYACVRPIRYFPGVQTPVKDSDLVSMVVFRENTQGLYAGVEFYPLSGDLRAKLEELRYLENSIGATGKLAMKPFMQMSQKDLWKIYVLSD